MVVALLANKKRAGMVGLLAIALSSRHKHLSFLKMDMKQAAGEKHDAQYHSLLASVVKHRKAADDEEDCRPDENATSTSVAGPT